MRPEEIGQAACRLSECLGAGLPPRQGDVGQAQARLARWLATAAGGNPEKFAQRLAWQGLDQESALRVLARDGNRDDNQDGNRDAPPDGAEPGATAPWLGLLRQLLSPGLAQDPPPPAPTGKAAPFAEALAPLVAAGLRLLPVAPPPALRQDVRRHLGEVLSDICALALGEEFERHRRSRGWVPGSGAERSELYHDFCAGFDTAGWTALFGRYPVLARLVATATGDWLDDTAEYLQRLERDLPAIRQELFAGVDPGAPLSFESSLSDPHDHGRAVRILRFGHGARLVYKPRGLALDQAWQALLRWLAPRGIALRAPRVLNRGGYGWAEFIAREPCADRAGVERFYHNAGMLACLVHAVMGNDLHSENLVASGSDPVPVDLETLFAPTVRPGSGDYDPAAMDRLRNTVIPTLLFPFWKEAPDGKSSYDISGLGGSAARQAAGIVKGWNHVNTDAMRYGERESSVAPSLNLPGLADAAIDPGDFVGEIEQGFAHAWRVLCREREALLAAHGPIAAFAGAPARVVLRDTSIYVQLRRRSLSPRFLRHGIERSLELEVLARTWLKPDERYDGRAIFLCELEALERLDVPRFECLTGSAALEAHGRRIEGVMEKPALDAVIQRIRGMDEADLRLQLELIRCSFATRRPPCPAALPRAGRAAADPALPQRGTLLAQAGAIADDIAQRAIRDAGGAQWIGLAYQAKIRRMRLGMLDAGLHSGSGGIALFFAALHATAGREPRHREMVLAIAQSIRRDLWGKGIDEDARRLYARMAGIGMANGLPGMAYALLLCGRLVEEPALGELAAQLGALVTPELVEAQHTADAVSGTAGAIFGLAALCGARGETQFHERLRQCADRLLATQLHGGERDGAWPQAGGQAGIARALLLAARITGTQKYRDAALRALACASRLAGTDGTPATPWSGLDHLGTWEEFPDTASCAAIEAAMDAAPRPHDTHEIPCADALLRLELRLEAGRRLARPDWIAAARQDAAALLAQAQAGSGYPTIAGPSHRVFAPGFFSGGAGLGYALLRLADDSARLPCVPLWQA